MVQKMPRRRCDRRRATSVDGVHRCRLPPVAAPCTMPLTATAFMSPQHVPSNPNEFLVIGGALCTPHLLELAPQFFAISKMPLATS